MNQDDELRLDNWLKSGEHMPVMMRDFHDQKDLFKVIHNLYSESESLQNVNWVHAHQYTIDCFLWYMAARGYTLQRSRKKVEFYDFENWRDMSKSLLEILKQKEG